jgi:hypothetical protein
MVEMTKALNEQTRAVKENGKMLQSVMTFIVNNGCSDLASLPMKRQRLSIDTSGKLSVNG